MEDELLVEDLPSPPATQEAISDEIDAALLTDVPKMGDAIPVGTYAFRLESFKEAWTSEKDGKKLKEEERQPYFALIWKCQQEPHVGRVVFENVPWLRKEDVKDAADQASPRRGEARKIINNRMPRAKEIMEAAGFNPTGNFGFKSFLGSNPELKLQLKLKERQAKGPDGKWKGTGEWGNEVARHISLHRPM